MSRGPLPSQLCLLSDLPKCKSGDKVRFLGCIISYSVSKGHLTLGHLYPKGTNVTAVVDVSLVLELVKPETTRVGEWVNVVGYRVEQPVLAARKVKALQKEKEKSPVQVQGLVVWSAGPMDLDRYERLFKKDHVD